MKSLAELQAIREQMKDKVAIRKSGNQTRVVVGMATCGIAAGARPVLAAFVEGVNENGLAESVSVTQTGCIGICQYEPVVEVSARPVFNKPTNIPVIEKQIVVEKPEEDSGSAAGSGSGCRYGCLR